MFLTFFLYLKREGLPVTLREYLDLLEALDKGIIARDTEAFYYLCRTVMVKHEEHLDRFDVLFGQFFGGVEIKEEEREIPPEWLEKRFERFLGEEEKKLISSMGGLEALMKRMQELLEEQKERHQGGSKWIGTGGTSPFGAYGYNPEGVRIGQHESRHRRAVKVWDKREFRNLDDTVEMDTRHLKMALRRLRLLTREGKPEELDVKGTIRKTSEDGGLLNLQMVPAKKNNIKILLLLDIGGSMDDHILACERLFSAARHEFKHLEHYYFHNCLYESVWKDNSRRWDEKIPTQELFNRFNSDYRVIMVGDASMSPFELLSPGGSVEHYNRETGLAWLKRLREHYPHTVWLNPEDKGYWPYTESIGIVQKSMNGRMFPLTLQGLGEAVAALKKPATAPVDN
ncbi:VWA domain-containing protein [Roseivirga sp. BDSF3-8]|uniref:vWA domain-containing protein n=1 Tax=Roseivirga sp. BDSF3-8 TaxID=3241598 RepID=UPI003531BEA8